MTTLPLLKLSEVGERLNLSTATVRRMVESGTLPSYRVGKSIRVAPGDLDAYVQAQRTKVTTTGGKGDGQDAR